MGVIPSFFFPPSVLLFCLCLYGFPIFPFFLKKKELVHAAEMFGYLPFFLSFSFRCRDYFILGDAK